LQDYLAGKRRDFTLPLAPAGTEFMLRVWEVLRAIPYGETRSYREIAQITGNQKASRAVGLANNRNPIPIFVPCHRVIGTNGKLTGYRGGLQTKERLLELEKQHAAL
jgi:methylated-DNA-[protein]-cysteine S-methyltransferase